MRTEQTWKVRLHETCGMTWWYRRDGQGYKGTPNEKAATKLTRFEAEAVALMLRTPNTYKFEGVGQHDGETGTYTSPAEFPNAIALQS